MSKKILMLLKSPRWMMLFTIGATLVFWSFDAVIDYLVHYDEEFLKILFPTGKELWFRAFFSICMLAFGSAISYLVNLNNRTERQLEESRSLYKDLVEFTSAVHWEVNPASMKFIYISPQVEHLLGYPVSHWRDLNFLYSITHPDDACRARAFFADENISEGDRQILLRLIGSNGQMIWMRFHCNLQEDGLGRKKIRGVSMNVSEFKQAEANLVATLREKNVLVQEVNHRVRNNLAVILAMLNLQLSEITDEQTRSVFKMSCNRIKTMAMVHDALYVNKDLLAVNIEQFFSDLVLGLCNLYGISTSGLKLGVRSNASCLSPECLMLCGMIVNELVTYLLINSMEGSACRDLRIELMAEGEAKSLVVSDAGQCMDGWIGQGRENMKKIGYKLVTALVEQLGGVLDYTTGDKGSQVIVRFS